MHSVLHMSLLHAPTKHVTSPPITHDLVIMSTVVGDPAKSSWTRFLPKILPNLPKTCPRSCPRCQDYAAKILAKILPKIWQDLSLLARSWPPAKILLFLARTLPKNFLLGDTFTAVFCVLLLMHPSFNNLFCLLPPPIQNCRQLFLVWGGGGLGGGRRYTCSFSFN